MIVGNEGKSAKVALKGLSAKGEVGEILLRQTSAFAIQHMMAAARFSRQCGEIQAANAGKPLGPFFDEMIACVSATVMLSVAAMESNINEYLSDPSKLFPALNAGATDAFVSLTNSLPILEKYQKVLEVRGLEVLDRGAQLYQDVDILVALRNELVHFHPEWHDEQERHAKLGRKLAYRFEPSPFISKENGVMFPQRFVGHGCAQWAVHASLAFIRAFSERVGANDKFERFMERMQP